MGLHHHHDHGNGAGDHVDVGTRRLGIAVAINLLLTVVQIVAGLAAGSLALIADSLHNLSDAAGLVLALVARRIAQRPADEDRTFGYGRAEVVGGLVNLSSVMVLAVYLLIEAASRSMAHPHVEGRIVVVVGAIALAVDVGTAILTYTLSKESVNIRAAFLHNVCDAAASVAVVVSGVLIVTLGWYWTDMAATAAISVYIVWLSIAPMKRCIRILMQSTPEQIRLADVAEAIRGIAGVNGLHHLHVWPIDERMTSLEARVVVDDAPLSVVEDVRDRIADAMRERFGITHCTIELHHGEDTAHPLVPPHHPH